MYARVKERCCAPTPPNPPNRKKTRKNALRGVERLKFYKKSFPLWRQPRDKTKTMFPYAAFYARPANYMPIHSILSKEMQRWHQTTSDNVRQPIRQPRTFKSNSLGPRSCSSKAQRRGSIRYDMMLKTCSISNPIETLKNSGTLTRPTFQQTIGMTLFLSIFYHYVKSYVCGDPRVPPRRPWDCQRFLRCLHWRYC